MVGLLRRRMVQYEETVPLLQILLFVSKIVELKMKIKSTLLEII